MVFHRLEEKIAALRATLSPRAASLIAPSQRAVEIASRVIADYYHYTKDPNTLYRSRRQAIEETLDLDKSPRVVLQTNPIEHSEVARDCVIDAHGWAEPGTILWLNGHQAAVESDGLFLAELPPSSTGRITAAARGNGAQKTFVRQFKLMDGKQTKM